MISQIKTNDKAAEKFSMLLNSFLDKLSDIDEENFPESELFDPIEFEDKMRNKAKLSEDIIKQGILLKSDIIVKYLNLQADMSKYLLKVQVQGLMDAINFLYSKGLAEVNYQKGNLHATAKCMKMDLEIVPEKLINVANKIGKRTRKD